MPNLQNAKDINNVEAQKAARSWIHYSDITNSRARLHRELQAKISLKLKAYRKSMTEQNAKANLTK
jgi:hypothetical protein